MSKTLVFDGDDTLWHVEWKYSQAYAEFFSYLYTVLKNYTPSLHVIYKTLFEVEEKNTKTWGVRRGRVAASMTETYQKICVWIQQTTGKAVFEETHQKQIADIGDQPFDVSQHHWIENAEYVLENLTAKNYRLCLLTKYDAEVWPVKAQHLQVNRFFRQEHIRVIHGRKTIEDFELAAGEETVVAENEAIFTVGNSENDMVPATKEYTHWRGFYIPLSLPTGFLEQDTNPVTLLTLAPTHHPRVKTLCSIKDLLDHV